MGSDTYWLESTLADPLLEPQDLSSAQAASFRTSEGTLLVVSDVGHEEKKVLDFDGNFIPPAGIADIAYSRQVYRRGIAQIVDASIKSPPPYHPHLMPRDMSWMISRLNSSILPDDTQLETPITKRFRFSMAIAAVHITDSVVQLAYAGDVGVWANGLRLFSPQAPPKPICNRLSPSHLATVIGDIPRSCADTMVIHTGSYRQTRQGAAVTSGADLTITDKRPDASLAVVDF